MSWIKLSDVHRCELPEFDPAADDHNVGALWRCDEDGCGRVWRLSLIERAPRQNEEGKWVWEGSYVFTKLNIEELHHWR